MLGPNYFLSSPIPHAHQREKPHLIFEGISMFSHVTQHSMEIDDVLHFTGGKTGQRGLSSTSLVAKPDFVPGLISKLIFYIWFPLSR